MDGLFLCDKFPRVEVMGVGAATRDVLLRVRGFAEGEGVSEVLECGEDGGGPVATALAVLGSLGRRTMLVDRMGADAEGEWVKRGLAAVGVEVPEELVAAGRCARAWIWVRAEDGARHIAFLPGDAPEIRPDEMRREWFEGLRLLHLNGRHEAAARVAVRWAREVGAVVSFDGGAGRWREGVRDLLEASQLRIVARDFAQQCTGETAVEAMGPAMLQGEAEVVVITDGVRGSWLWSRQGEVHQEPACPAAVVDTTGCGDVYHGAFLHGWLEGWPWPECMAWAARW
ncbi:MAG: carbohydrate kinase family protein, partial [Verrucomicrobiales bacterium]|nr:carbohydrate kinase family protein [Verrucomicrobiales bacterium]